jgi:hypothetical protein
MAAMRAGLAFQPAVILSREEMTGRGERVQVI